MPTMNRPQYLEMAINSIVEQDYEDWELHVVWAGEEPNKVKDERVRYWRQMTPGGIIPAVNEGLNRCRGGYLNWSNDDDLMAPGTLSWVVENLNNPYGWTYGRCAIIDAEGNPISEFGGETWDKEYEKQRNLCPQPSVFWTKEMFLDVGFFDDSPEMDLAADWDYWIRLSHFGDPLVTQRIQAYYRQWDGSITVARRGEQDNHAAAVRKKHG